MALPAQQVSDPLAQMNFEALQAAIFQPGDMKPTMAANAPARWVFAQGQSLATSSYPELAQAMGVTGATITLPDLRGRMPVGAGTGAGLTARTLAAIGGEETHLLLSAESGTAPHSHGVTDTGHAHTVSPRDAGSSGLGDPTARGNPAGAGSGPTPTSSATTGIGIQNAAAADASTAHNNMPPFVAVNWIIYTG